VKFEVTERSIMVGTNVKKNEHLEVARYIDADWARAIDDRESTAGYFTFAGGNLVIRRSKK
jgi:hypothetical protein